MWICANDERIRYTGRIDCRVEAIDFIGKTDMEHEGGFF